MCATILPRSVKPGVPPTPRPERRTRSELRDGMVVPPTGMEVIVTDHCNIACRQCNHGSPVLPKWSADPDETGRTLTALAQSYRPAFLKYIGGEPLLHPDLPAVIRAGRASGIAPHHMLVTNGLLLDRMPASVWGLIDEIEISRYPGAGLDTALLDRARHAAAAHGVRFTLNDYPMFRRTFTRRETTDPALVQAVFKGCKIANVWGCHGVYRGAIYRCPQSMYALTLAGAQGFDGLPIEPGPAFAARLLAFLNGAEPLASCRYCIGTAGRKEPHALLTRRDWPADLDEPAEQMIDPAVLDLTLREVIPVDDCKTPARPSRPVRLWQRLTGRSAAR
ncbi:radical SAM protein [Fuscovulum blasticum]|uniref:radical SAM protein n=1 Tax=Fuscovulum blasticum TaxID=1075 RepID=UPI000D3E0B57|nr:hypothetical protein [Fuscovulum blasticum]AWD23188.1 hypothetical protein B6K69_17165 [Fuscovulum blasticum]